MYPTFRTPKHIEVTYNKTMYSQLTTITKLVLKL